MPEPGKLGVKLDRENPRQYAEERFKTLHAEGVALTDAQRDRISLYRQHGASPRTVDLLLLQIRGHSMKRIVVK